MPSDLSDLLEDIGAASTSVIGTPSGVSSAAATTETVLTTLDYEITHNAAAVSSAGNVRMRNNGGVLQVSADGGDYHDLAEGNPSRYDASSFGMSPDNTAAQNTAAFDAAMEAMANAATSRGRTLRLPYGTIPVNTLRVTRSCRIEGCGSAGTWNGTTLQVAAGYDGIVVDAYETSPDAGFGDWTTIANLLVTAAAKTTTAHGIRLNARARVSSCSVTGFKGDGVHIVADTATLTDTIAWPASTAVKIGDRCTNDSGKGYVCIQAGTTASSGGPTGTNTVSISDGTAAWRYAVGTNANNWFLDHVRTASNDGHGVYVQGGDSNAGIALGVDASSNGGWGIWDYSFLGNTYVGCHTTANTLGPYKSNGLNARNLFLGCYSESGQPASSIDAPATVVGGIHAATVTGTGYFWVDGAFSTTTYSRTYGSHLVSAGGDDILQVSSTGATYPVRLKHYPLGGSDAAQAAAAWNYANSGGYTGHGFALEDGLYNLNAPRKRWMQATQLFTGPTHGLINEGCRISHSDDPTVAPELTGYRTFLTGDIVFKKTPVSGASPGWMCTVSGSVGTYTEGCTATSAGGTSLTLNTATSRTLLSGLHVGDWITCNGANVQVTAVSSNGLTLTVSGAVTAGSGLAIAFYAPTFKAMANLA